MTKRTILSLLLFALCAGTSFPMAADAEKAGYVRYTSVDDTGAISYANCNWESADGCIRASSGTIARAACSAPIIPCPAARARPLRSAGASIPAVGPHSTATSTGSRKIRPWGL